MGKLHEILAVEASHKGMVDKTLAETKVTFNKQNAAYTGFSKTYTPKKEDDRDTALPQSKTVGYTVAQKIAYVADHYIKLLDVLLQKEKGNQIAKADLVISIEEDGITKDLTLAKDVPATLLLSLEHRFEELRAILNEAPTCDPNYVWHKDTNGLGYATDPVQTLRTKKEPRVVVLLEPTQYHPGKAEMLQEDIPVGTWTEILKSGALLVHEKSALLARVDMLIRAAKKARMRANDIEIGKEKMGKAIFDFIKGGLGG
jgi:hypothetical protein